MTEGTAYTIIAVSLIVIAVCSVVTIAIVAAVAIFLTKQFKVLIATAKSFTEVATAAVNTVNPIIQSASSSAQTIINSVQETALDVSARIKRTSALAEETVTAPLTAIGTILTGISTIIKTLLGDAKSKPGN